MDIQKLEAIAKMMVAPGKGLLAADENPASSKKRFEAVGASSTKDSRETFRGILITTPQIDDYLSGVVLSDETFWQSTDRGHVFRDYLKTHGILPGIKIDTGLVELAGFDGEKIAEGLDGLAGRLEVYAGAGAAFTRWRCVIAVNGDGTLPTDEAIGANTLAQARYARICQDAGLVPIVETELLIDGNHSIERSEEVLAHVHDILFQTLRAFRVYLPAVVLRTSMVLPGGAGNATLNHDDVVERTARELHDHVPAEIAGVVLIGGGQTAHDALINLNRIAHRGPHPWSVTFSFARPVQDAVLKTWSASPHDVDGAQQTFARQISFAAKASKGELDETALERDGFVTGTQDL